MFQHLWAQFRRLRIKSDWEERCILSEQHESLFTKWLRERRSGNSDQHLMTEMTKIREKQYRLAARLGISDESVIIVAKRDNDGNFPPCPKWIMNA